MANHGARDARDVARQSLRGDVDVVAGGLVVDAVVYFFARRNARRAVVPRVERGQNDARVDARREVCDRRRPAQRGVRAPVREENDGFGSFFTSRARRRVRLRRRRVVKSVAPTADPFAAASRVHAEHVRVRLAPDVKLLVEVRVPRDGLERGGHGALGRRRVGRRAVAHVRIFGRAESGRRRRRGGRARGRSRARAEVRVRHARPRRGGPPGIRVRADPFPRGRRVHARAMTRVTRRSVSFL